MNSEIMAKTNHKIKIGKTKAVVPPAKKNYVWYYILIFIVAFLGYQNTFHNGYVLDDYSVIKENFVVKRGAEGIPIILKTGYRYGYWNSPDNLYRPLPLMMYAYEWELWPDNPTSSHIISVLLYGLLCVLLFKLLLKLFASYNMLLPLLSTLFFAWHPIHTEVVANIKSRDEILAFLFVLVSILLVLSYVEKKSTIKIVFAMFSFLLALLSKESAIMFLVLLPLILYFFTSLKTSKNISLSVLFLLPTLIFFVMRYKAIGNQEHIDSTTLVDNLLLAAPDYASRLATSIKIMGKYLWILIFPYPLACDYSYNQIPIAGILNLYTLLSFALYLLMAYIAFRLFKKKHLISFIILFFFVTMSIYSNIVLLIGSSFGERFLFVPSLAFTMALSYLILYALKSLAPDEKQSQKNIFFSKAFLIAIPILALYFSITLSRNKDWESNLSLYEADIKTSPKSAHMNYYYGLEVMKGKAMKDGAVVKPEFLDSAIYYFNRAKKIVPTFADAYDQLGLAYFRKNEWDMALAYYDTCLTMAPGKSITYSNMGVIYFNHKQYDKALEAYENAVRYDPKFSDGWLNLGSTYGTLGKYNEAIAAFKKCIEYNPQNAMAHYFIGITYQSLGDAQNAKYYLDLAGQLDPKLKK
jgi:tetratricopeptide (TPR) repeat protein